MTKNSISNIFVPAFINYSHKQYIKQNHNRTNTRGKQKKKTESAQLHTRPIPAVKSEKSVARFLRQLLEKIAGFLGFSKHNATRNGVENYYRCVSSPVWCDFRRFFLVSDFRNRKNNWPTVLLFFLSSRIIPDLWIFAAWESLKP